MNRSISLHSLCSLGLAVLLGMVLCSPPQSLAQARARGDSADTARQNIDGYYHFIHWVSVGRLDRALDQFEPTATVVAGSACPVDDPCIGRAAIAHRYLPALAAKEIPLPLTDQRFDGITVRTHGDTVWPTSHKRLQSKSGDHEITLRAGRIVSLRFDAHPENKARPTPPSESAVEFTPMPGRDEARTEVSLPSDGAPCAC
jgi:hypothetical protein